jgi:hypothetical protein
MTPTHNCSTCGTPLINKENTSIEPVKLYCHEHWQENWDVLLQLIREGKHEIAKKSFTLQRTR